MVTNNSSNIPTAASGKVLQGAGVGSALTFSTPTYPSASGTSGKILISDGTNNIYSTPTYPAAAGTSGNVLTSDGTNWTSAAAPSGGASFLIQTKTTTSGTTVDFTTGITSTYTTYLFILSNVLPNGSDTFLMRYSTDGGSTFLTSSYVNSTGVTNAISIATNTQGSSAPGCWGDVFIENATTANLCTTNAHCSEVLSGTINNGNASGYHSSATAVNAFRFLWSGGSSFTAGTISLYGLTH